MIDKVLILDLDDTIFQTRSMDKKEFDPFFKYLISRLRPVFSELTVERIVDDLWRKTWDTVIDDYRIPEKIFLNAIDVLNRLELNLNISPYPDYAFIHSLKCTKFLVTTSVTSIQLAKIKALRIETDFKKIIINDPFINGGTKLDCFRELVREFNLIPEHTYVIGDNDDSEIKAGKALNMITVQVLRDNVKKGKNARFYINSFNELESIIA